MSTQPIPQPPRPLPPSYSAPVQFTRQYVVVSDVDMSIGNMCMFMVKWAIASIPALFILTLLVVITVAVFGGLAGVLGSLHR